MNSHSRILGSILKHELLADELRLIFFDFSTLHEHSAGLVCHIDSLWRSEITLIGLMIAHEP